MQTIKHPWKTVCNENENETNNIAKTENKI